VSVLVLVSLLVPLLAAALGLASAAWPAPELASLGVPVWVPMSPESGLGRGLVLLSGLALAHRCPHTKPPYLLSTSCNSPLKRRTTSLAWRRSQDNKCHKCPCRLALQGSTKSYHPSSQEMASQPALAHTMLHYLLSTSCNLPQSWRTTSLVWQRIRGSTSHKHLPRLAQRDSTGRWCQHSEHGLAMQRARPQAVLRDPLGHADRRLHLAGAEHHPHAPKSAPLELVLGIP